VVIYDDALDRGEHGLNAARVRFLERQYDEQTIDCPRLRRALLCASTEVKDEFLRVLETRALLTKQLAQSHAERDRLAREVERLRAVILTTSNPDASGEV
jgi:hypothetical protein